MKKSHLVLYATSIIWDLIICWPTVLAIRLLWGENLRWETNADPKVKDGPSLWCDLRSDSWPTRSWYAMYRSKNWLAFLTKEEPIKGLTWGGTTLGHGGFYGPGVAKIDGWTRTQDHEHHHVEQFEVSMLRSFTESVVVVVPFLIEGHWIWAPVVGLTLWFSGGLAYGAASWASASMRGKDAYRGSTIEQAAYSLDDDWQDGIPEKDED